MQNFIRQLLLRLDPEPAHAIAKHLIRLRYAKWAASRQIQKPVTVFGLDFPNPVGLAAGWDNNGTCFNALLKMGFGFVEVGGVTPKPQEGNPKPRVFRIPKKQALINRMGFSNAGVDALAVQLQTRQTPGIVGVNITKNKETPLHHALDDYRYCLKTIYPYADYVVVNISSPNTPGLRELQSHHYLPDLLRGIQNAKKELAGRLHKDVPLLIKTSVDLPVADYESFVQTLMDQDIDGVVISNTTLDHSAVAGLRYADEAGGLSGAPVRERVTQMIRCISEISEKKLPIIGVGGIMSARDASKHYQAGAQLVQVFTGFVYHGMKLVDEMMEHA